ncbi:hypothetical protein CB1_001091013 [Camelus ferus]|nr:hypothetical protein CB1_001091013 [Camelus ferus]
MHSGPAANPKPEYRFSGPPTMLSVVICVGLLACDLLGNVLHSVQSYKPSMKPGDIITLLEDSNEDWWKGKIQDRIGFFPANFVQRVQQNEKIFRCVRTFTGCKEQGQITLKENQICVTSEEEQDGFIRVLSGKKRGLVPLDVLENI